jgi:hypothetical protein
VVTSKDDRSVRAVGLTEEKALNHFGRALGEALDLEKLRIRKVIEYRMVGDEAQANRQRLLSRWKRIKGPTGETGIKVEPLTVERPQPN